MYISLGGLLVSVSIIASHKVTAQHFVGSNCSKYDYTNLRIHVHVSVDFKLLINTLSEITS